MKNKAKCKLCNSVVESFHSTDYVECKCGEIAVHGGDAMQCFARDFKNFLRVDDQGNDIVVIVKDVIEKPDEITPKPTKKEKIEMLREMTKSIENLPQQAMISPINHYDLWASLALLLSILEDEA